MAWSRFGRSSLTHAANVGAVYSALVGDNLLREQLVVVHRKLFESGGARRGAGGPDHFLYVQPSRARCEIQELSRWVSERFGPPGARVPATTPFGYLSGRWQGWITYFAALATERDDNLRRNFDAAIAPLFWSSAAPARSQSPSRAVATGGEDRPARSRDVSPEVEAERERRDLEEEERRREERQKEEELRGRRDLEEEERRREERQEEEIKELRAQRDFLREQIAQAETLAARGEVHSSVREGKTGEKIHGTRSESAAAPARKRSTSHPEPAAASHPEPAPPPHVRFL